jgi:hypothetical protein
MKYGLDIPKEHQLLAFNSEVSQEASDKISTFARNEFLTVDMFVIEISTRTLFSCDGVFFNSNYLEHNLVRSGGRPLLNWWRSVSKRSDNHQEMVEETVKVLRESDQPPTEEMISIIRNTRKQVQSPEELVGSIQALVDELEVPIVIVPVFNVPENPIRKRTDLMRILVAHAPTVGYHVYDSTHLIEEVGSKAALLSNGADVNHYNESFHHTLVKEFAPFLHKAYHEHPPGTRPLIEADLPQSLSEDFDSIRLISADGLETKLVADPKNDHNQSNSRVEDTASGR